MRVKGCNRQAPRKPRSGGRPAYRVQGLGVSQMSNLFGSIVGLILIVYLLVTVLRPEKF
jgi:K+-transporting ATPase KdpF subunit